MMIATDSDVKLMVASMAATRVKPSLTLSRMFMTISEACPGWLDNAVAAVAPDHGFVLYVPHARRLDLKYGLVAFVRDEHRQKGLGKALANIALIGIEDRTTLRPLVWTGNATAYLFWRSVGVVTE